MELIRLTGGGGVARIVRRFFEDREYMASAGDGIDGALDPEAPTVPHTGAHGGAPTPPTLRVLTLNTWGIPISPFCNARHCALSRALFGDDSDCEGSGSGGGGGGSSSSSSSSGKITAANKPTLSSPPSPPLSPLCGAAGETPQPTTPVGCCLPEDELSSDNEELDGAPPWPGRRHSCRYDVITLQEVWHRRERDVLIAAAAAAGLVHHHYFEAGAGFPLWRGVEGTGLLVLSRWPLTGARYRRYSVSGSLYKLHEADYLGAKGCGVVRVCVPLHSAGLPRSSAAPCPRHTCVVVATTHLLSSYCEPAPPGSLADVYYARRVCEAFELAQFLDAIMLTGRGGGVGGSVGRSSSLLVLTGDFNMGPSSLVVRMPTALAQLRDAYTEGCSSGGGGDGGGGATYGCSDNRFSCDDIEARLDLVLFRAGAPGAATTTTTDRGDGDDGVWCCTRSAVVKLAADLPDEAAGQGEVVQQVPLSDHAGVEATFELCAAAVVTTEGTKAKAAAVPHTEQCAMLLEAHALARKQAQATLAVRDGCMARASAGTWLLAAVIVWWWVVAPGLRAQLGGVHTLTVACLATFVPMQWFYGHFIVGEEFSAVKETARAIRLEWESLRAASPPRARKNDGSSGSGSGPVDSLKKLM